MNLSACPDCGAAWTDDQTCTDHFHTLGFWELDHRLYDVHHLMVLCYHIQHPALYSPETLRWAIGALREFVETDLTPDALRQRIRRSVASDVRGHRIAGTPDHHGGYRYPVDWSMTVADVVAAGIDRYYESVRAWAAAILADLRRSGNLDLHDSADFRA